MSMFLSEIGPQPRFIGGAARWLLGLRLNLAFVAVPSLLPAHKAKRIPADMAHCYGARTIVMPSAIG
jgi:hypothetical protein